MVSEQIYLLGNEELHVDLSAFSSFAPFRVW